MKPKAARVFEIPAPNEIILGIFDSFLSFGFLCSK